MLTFSPNPVTYLPDGGNLQDVFITSLSGEAVSTTLAFLLIPDAGDCAAFDQGVPPEGGGSIALTCNLTTTTSSQWSISANAAGTVVTIESMLDSNGDVTCGSLFYSCDADGDCCNGFNCQTFDAGPSRGEVQACYYSWPSN
jgi:hypothetical protein